MKNILIDISNFTENFETIGKIKRILEDKWIKERRIKESLDITSFIRELKLQENIFVFNEDTVMPYRYFDFDGDRYFFYCNVNDSSSKCMNSLCDIVNRIELNQLKLVAKTNTELLNEGLTQPKFPYFIFGQTIKEIRPVE